MKVFKLLITCSIVSYFLIAGCRQIFGDDDQPVSIVQPPDGGTQLIITLPARGSIWKPGDNIVISWLSNSISRIDIQLFRKSVYQFTITEGSDNSGSFNWAIPTDINLSNHYIIKIIDHNNPDVFKFSERFGIQ